MRLIAKTLQVRPKATLLFGKSGVEPAVSAEIFNFRLGNIQGLALDIVANKNRAGAGISKDILRKEYAEVDVGLYVSKRFRDLFSSSAPDINVGVSWRF